MADVDRRRAKPDDLEEFLNYVKTVNELAKRLRKLWEVEVESPSSLAQYMGMYIPIPFDHAKKWKYLLVKNEKDNEKYYLIKIDEQLYLGNLLVLYKAYENGLFKKIIKEAEKALPNMRRQESLLRKASSILEIMGVPQA